MSAFIDLTHIFDDGMPVYPGDASPTLKQVGRLATDGFNEFCYCGGFHVGTHMDAPLHMIADGSRISDIPADRFFGRGRLVDARGADEVTPKFLDGLDIRPGDMIVVLTGWYKMFREKAYYGAFPSISSEFADCLVERQVSVLALDTPSPDRPPFPVHKILLGNGVLIIENLTNVEALLNLKNFEVVALPAKYKWEAASVRVIACPR